MKKQLLALTLLAAAASLKAQNPYPIIPIDSVQYVSPQKLAGNPSQDLPDYINPTFKNATYRDTVRFEGIVVTNPKAYGLSLNRKAAYVQKPGGGPWSGVLVMCDPTASSSGMTLPNFLNETQFYENMVPGSKVLVTAKFAAFDKETQMNVFKNNANWSNAVEQVDLNTYVPVVTTLTIDSLMLGNPTAGNWVQKKVEGEKWEGVLVEFKNVVVNTRSAFGSTRWNWSIFDANGNQLDIRDMSAYFRNDDNEDTVPKIPNTFTPPAIGTVLSSIRGIVTEYQIGGVYRYGLSPIYPSDVVPCTVCPPTIGTTKREPVIATQADAITITASVLSDTVISSAKVFYTFHKDFNYLQVSMTKNPDDTWSGIIPAQPADSIIKFYVQATDGRNLTSLIQEEKSFLIVNGALTEIPTLQFSNNATYGTIWSGDSLVGMDVKGVVTATRLLNMTVVQQGRGANSAIYIQNNDLTDSWAIGDSVRITSGAIRENFNVTTLYNIGGEVLAKRVALPEPEMGLPIDSFRLNRVAYSRPWEGVLMSWDSVFVASVNADSAAGSNFGEWSFNYQATDTLGLRADDANPSILNINRSLTQGQHLENVTGVMYFSFSNFKLMPRNLSDMSLCNMDTVAPVLSVSEFDTVEVGSGPYVSNATAVDGRDGNLTSYIITSGTVNTSATGSYTLKLMVSDFCGNIDSATLMVNVKDTPTVGLIKNELTAADIKVYPSPATDVITISAKEIKTLPLTVAVYDVVGREMLTRTYTQNNVNDTINIASLNSGVYFCVIKNAQGSRTIKFMVNGK
jgi:hypothetical protein